MKRMLLTLAVLLLSSPILLAQEDGYEPGARTGLVVSRIDRNAYRDWESKKSGFDEGDTALYSVFEGDITPELFFCVSNVWLTDEPIDLYKDTGRPNSFNWLNMAYLRYDFPSNIYVQAGKGLLFAGSMENDEYDYDLNCERCSAIGDLCSSIWYNFPIYQWGVNVGWYTPDERTIISAQVATSPYGKKFFYKGMYSFGLEWRGEYGPIQNMWQISLVATERGKYTPLVSLGQSYSPSDNMKITLDVFNRVCDEYLHKGISAHGLVSWYPIPEKLEIEGKVGYEHTKDEVDFNYDSSEKSHDDEEEKAEAGSDVSPLNAWVVGGGLSWYPLRDSKDLRLHAYFSHNELSKRNSFSIGVTYYLKFYLSRK